jgi:hypothetical protein
MSTRRKFLESVATLPLSYFFLPRTLFGHEETIDEMISSGGSFSVALLPVDQINTNNRIYPNEVVQKAIIKLGNDPLFGLLDGFGYPLSEMKVPLKDVAFSVKHFRISRHNDYCNGRWLWGDVKILDTPQGLAMKKILRSSGLDNYAFRTGGTGCVTTRDGVYHISRFSFLAAAMISARKASKIALNSSMVFYRKYKYKGI